MGKTFKRNSQFRPKKQGRVFVKDKDKGGKKHNPHQGEPTPNPWADPFWEDKN